jgi:hypothetical protein
MPSELQAAEVSRGCSARELQVAPQGLPAGFVEL